MCDLLTCSDVPDYGLLNDLVWSDPSDTALDWEDNERGVSFCYGKSVINAFLATHVSACEDGVAGAILTVAEGYGLDLPGAHGGGGWLRVLQRPDARDSILRAKVSCLTVALSLLTIPVTVGNST